MRSLHTIAVVGASLAAAAAAAVASVAFVFFYQHHHFPRTTKKKLLPKPQRNFKLVLADNSPLPFVHLRRPGHDTGKHPFHEEINTILENAGKVQSIASTEPTPPAMGTSCIWIDRKEQLENLVKLLSEEREFGVDTEQHSVRSFLGFTALLQVSTRKQDFLVDTIALHDEMVVLRDVFANPDICKVFHGADSDILWLQRDFHIYIVNLFDTARACDVLGKPQRSLAYLLQSYCNIETNKIFQRADWRLRPLPEEMITYACTDAHFLLYIADCLKNELLESSCVEISGSGSLYEECMKRSNMICLQLYEKDVISPSTIAVSLILRHNGKIDGYKGTIDEKLREDERFQNTVHALCKWRDATARAEDESHRFVLSDQAILALAKKGSSRRKAILACICETDESFPTSDIPQYMTPLPSPSPVLLQNMNSLMSLLKSCEEATTDIEIHMKSDKLNIYESKGGSLFKFMNLFKSSKVSSKIKQDVCLVDKSNQAPARHLEHQIHRRRKAVDFEASREQFVKKFSCKAPVYHNCRIYAGDGRLLCFCDRKKLDWYVQRGLAEFIDENTPAIKLLFEPKGRPEDDNNEFYIQSKTNRCVGCGESSHYLRYRVIPSCYRQHFPEHLKSHRSHDIVLLCVDCHEVAHRTAEKHKRQVAADFGVPLFARRVVDSGEENGFEAKIVDAAKGGVSPLQLRTAAMALLRHGKVMPKDRQEELEAVVKAYYGGRQICQEDIEAALLVGKGPRELRRLRKRKGLYIDKLLKTLDSQRADMDEDALTTRTNELKRVNDSSSSPPSITDGMMDLLEGTQVAEEFDVKYDMVSMENMDGTILFTENSSCTDMRSLYIEDGEISMHQELKDDKVIHEKVVHQENELTIVGTTHVERHSEKFSFIEKRTQRISLLGHGPHGKKVVDMILQEEGESGIARFCQRWRAVFVESVKPTHLPPGWDILHSGQREFGEYSVYNPSKKASKNQ